MKWLVLILVIILFVVIAIAFRYRKQLTMGWQMWKMFRMMRQAGKPTDKKPEKKQILKDTPLVRCEKCGKWISPEGALKLRQEKYYCSSTCMEKAAKLQSLVD